MLRNAGNAPTFTSMDKNNDGILNQEEFRLHQNEQMSNKGNCVGNCPNPVERSGRNVGNAPEFSDIDTDNDGMISKEEFKWHQSQRMQMRNN